jgi:dolichol-phosphate mannosyltransferase
MDADFSHDPKDIIRLIEICENGFHLAIGSRKINGGKIIGWNWKRKLMSHGAMFLSRLILHLRTKDVTAGFRCYHHEVLKKINLDNIKSNGYAFQEEMLYRTEKLGFTIAEIPVTFKDRKHGQSKLGKKEIKEFFIVIFKLKFKKYGNKKISS